MKIDWHYSKSGNEIVSDVYRRKVTHVVQHNRTALSDYCYWKGELDDDKYFMVQVFNSIILLTISDREGELFTKNPTVVAYTDCIKSIVDESTETQKVQKFITAKLDFIPEFMKSLTFEQIMSVFMWEYSSPTVEVYEHILV